jgi:hypothetical protein
MDIKLNIFESKDEILIDNACRIHYKSKKCKSCKKYIQSNNKIGKIYKKNGKIHSTTLKVHNKLSNKCDKCSSIKTKKCNSKQIKNYSKWYYGK